MNRQQDLETPVTPAPVEAKKTALIETLEKSVTDRVAERSKSGKDFHWFKNLIFSARNLPHSATVKIATAEKLIKHLKGDTTVDFDMDNFKSRD